MKNSKIKEYQIFRNGTHHANIWAKNIKEARAICFDWYGKELEVYLK